MNKITHIHQVPPEKGHYIAGFVDGEGSFYISARKRTDYPSGWRFELHFNVSNQDLAVLEICRKYLGCGTIRQTRPASWLQSSTHSPTVSKDLAKGQPPAKKCWGAPFHGLYTLEVESRKKLGAFVIPFFKKFGFLSNKKKAEFRIFQQAFDLLEQGISTPEQLNQLLRLRQKLNELRRTRITNTDAMIIESFHFMKESSETIR